MKSSYRKKLEKAANYLREVYDDLETEGSDDFDEYGPRLEDLAGEIEDLLAAHPAVGDVAVIGLPDAERGELVCAVIEQPPGAEELTLPSVVSYLRAEGLSVHKLPERLEVVDALPRNETLRKVLKYRLRERFSQPPDATPGR